MNHGDAGAVLGQPPGFAPAIFGSDVRANRPRATPLAGEGARNAFRLMRRKDKLADLALGMLPADVDPGAAIARAWPDV